MKRIDVLIRKTKKLIREFALSWFSGNDDGFLEALGVDPVKYERVAPDGTIGYDFLAALNDTARECWEGWELEQ